MQSANVMGNEAKEEIRSRLNIEDVIGEYVALKRSGRNFKGLSPFSSEKTPSFFVSPEKHIWHDFSSNKGGDVFSFVMEVEGMSFREALEHLARKAGVDLSQYDTKGSQELAKRKKVLFEANRLAAQYFQQSLLKNKHALEYVFANRKFSKKVVEDFMIGYAPDSGQALVNFLTKKGFSKKDLADAGLTNRFGGDMFRGRMTVPLMDATGQVIGFTARIIGEVPNAPKYLNTPQTLLYDKSRHVFGLSQAKESIRKHGYAVIVEGNLDVVSSHQAEVAQTVATAGTAITEYHLKALNRLVSDVRLAFDADAAGLAATERAIELANKTGVELTIVSLPDSAKDPDELIQKDKKQWISAIENSVPAVDWVLAHYEKNLDISTAGGKRDFTTAGLKLVKLLGDPVEREHYEQKIAKIVGSSLEAVRAKLDMEKAPAPKRLRPVEYKDADPNNYVYQDNALAVASLDAASQELFAHFDLKLLEGEERQLLANYFAKHHDEALTTTPNSLSKYDTYVKIILLKAETRYSEWSEQDRYFETARLIRQIEKENKKQTKDKLDNELREAERTGDDAKAESLRRELNKLIKEIARG